jgi:hypothetical protein
MKSLYFKTLYKFKKSQKIFTLKGNLILNEHTALALMKLKFLLTYKLAFAKKKRTHMKHFDILVATRISNASIAHTVYRFLHYKRLKLKHPSFSGTVHRLIFT